MAILKGHSKKVTSVIYHPEEVCIYVFVFLFLFFNHKISSSFFGRFICFVLFLFFSCDLGSVDCQHSDSFLWIVCCCFVFLFVWFLSYWLMTLLSVCLSLFVYQVHTLLFKRQTIPKDDINFFVHVLYRSLLYQHLLTTQYASGALPLLPVDRLSVLTMHLLLA